MGCCERGCGIHNQLSQLWVAYVSGYVIGNQHGGVNKLMQPNTMATVKVVQLFFRNPWIQKVIPERANSTRRRVFIANDGT
jgi:hypothetical protein